MDMEKRRNALWSALWPVVIFAVILLVIVEMMDDFVVSQLTVINCTEGDILFQMTGTASLVMSMVIYVNIIRMLVSIFLLNITNELKNNG